MFASNIHPVTNVAQDRVIPVALVTLIIVILHNIVHEAGHALAAKGLGYDVIARINHLDVVGGSYRNVGEANWISLAGPIVTTLIALGAWLGARRWPLALSLVGAALAMRLIAAAASLGYPNDEARVSLAVGLGKWTLFVLVISYLAVLFVTLYRRTPRGWRWWLGSYIGASVGFAFNVLGEPYLPALHF